MMTSEQEYKCPECGEILSPESRYHWCAKCEWGIRPAMIAESAPANAVFSKGLHPEEHQPVLPPADVALRERIYIWLGFWRDEMPVKAVSALQDILGPLAARPAQGDE